ncbi:peptidoglycan editing factor PgeF [Shewanella sp. D64]|uniref:peptidoglycan editing factor PgeF n=1 Tax=unclassified Shewanella TaxID=196818 RepID=UPI0022BA2999|nr:MULTISPECIES: peptidoglycan editing factor PgeF [unclassified Shewanella]MEC4728171.1 peptidoglycan editing factor PgeF [Shewanella sp. D64]MEC4739968.1 peptidoglycan editing factor PgeF [Shewanella sp. E94]WBJ94329.1 peptidoglycan editing factor PgeF [Shewanella sp. MTB7]
MKDKGWHIPNGVNIAFTTRRDGVSSAPYASLNLGLHVGDVIDDVLANRVLVQERLQLPVSAAWLNQIHSTDVVKADNRTVQNADASYTDSLEQVCVVMTADCLPILLCDQAGTQVCAVHAGWKGLCDGIIEVALGTFDVKNSRLIAYLGPAIGPEQFEVGAEVRALFLSRHVESEQYFIKKLLPISCLEGEMSAEDKYFADLQGLAKLRLTLAGVTEVYQSDICTFNHPDEYFSYRRDKTTGRMASYIWLS